MFVKITSRGAREKIQKMVAPAEMIDYHYYSDRTGITHVQKILDGFDISKIKGAKVVKQPKEELFVSHKILTRSTAESGRF